MAQAMKSLFNNAQISRFCRQHYSFRQMCGYNKDLTTRQTIGTDFLLQNLKNAANTRNVLEMVSKHKNIMSNKHIMQALRSLFTLQKHGSSELSTSEILAHPDFHKLCHKLRTQAGSIELNETIEALKVVSYVGVSANSTIVQVLLQLVRHNINNLNLQQIIFLDFLISQFPSSPLVDALKIALPMVFEIHLPHKIEYDNVQQLADYLYFASKKQLNTKSFERIVAALTAQSSEFDAKIAKSLLWSICDMKHDDMFEPLVKAALKSLNIHFDEMTYSDMETTLSKLAARYSKKVPYFYDEVFYESCANYVIDNDLGFKHSIYILRKFTRVAHYNNYLLDYMAKKALEDPKLILESSPADIYSIVTAVALTEYRPNNWDKLKDLIAKTERLVESERREIILIKFAASLCLLDIYKLDVLAKALNENYLHRLFKNKYLSDFEHLATIWQCIKLKKPELSGLLPSRFNPSILLERVKFLYDSSPLEAALEKALGGDKYVISNLSSKLGIHLDHVVVFRKGGYPVAANKSEDSDFIEDLRGSPDNQIVVIQALSSIRYTINNRQLKYHTVFIMKLLEAHGYTVVPICLEVWESLPDFEKIPFLMRAIKEKVDEDLNVNENVV